MYNQSDLISACHNAPYPIELEELEFKVAWCNHSNQFCLLFDQIDWYYSERGFCAGARYIMRDLDIGVIPDGRQWMLKNLVDRFNDRFDMSLTY